MIIEMLVASMLSALGLYIVYIKQFKPTVSIGEIYSRYRNYRKERLSAIVEMMRRAVLKYPYQIQPEDSPGLYPGRCLRL